MEIDQRKIEAQVGQRPPGGVDGRGFGDLGPEGAEMGREPSAENGVILQEEYLASGGQLGVNGHGFPNASDARAFINTILERAARGRWLPAADPASPGRVKMVAHNQRVARSRHRPGPRKIATPLR
jgi:hypothetical protein